MMHGAYNVKLINAQQALCKDLDSEPSQQSDYRI